MKAARFGNSGARARRIWSSVSAAGVIVAMAAVGTGGEALAVGLLRTPRFGPQIRLCWLLWLLAAVLRPTPVLGDEHAALVAKGDSLVLDGTQSPLEQGWSVIDVMTGEREITTDGNAVTLNTVGVPGAPGTIMLFYRDVDISPGFAVEFRLQVLEVPHPRDPYDAAPGIYGGFDSFSGVGNGVQRAQAIQFDEGSVGWGDHSQFSAMDTTDAFHTYRLEVTPAGAAVVRIDGEIALQRQGFETNGIIAFGDATNDVGLDARYAVDYVAVLRDCNQNGIPDEEDLASGTSPDCNGNGLPDECEPDCNENYVADECDIQGRASQDCNANEVPDECDIRDGTSNDCDGNGVPIECDLASGTLADDNSNGVPDVCEVPVLFVNGLAPSGGAGRSWTDAYQDLEEALAFARNPRGIAGQIWIAQGTYVPSKRTDPEDPRSATFALIDGVGLFGGFAGWESSIDQRDINAHPTILSGDLNGDDVPEFVNYGENSYHVVTAIELPTWSVFDGLTISGGHSPGPGSFGSYGAGVHLENARLDVRNGTFTANLAERPETNVAWSGGGGAALFLYDQYSEQSSLLLQVSNSRFSDNSATGDGGAVMIWSSTRRGSAEFSLCTFGRNVGDGALTVYGTACTVRSCVFSDNSSEAGGGAINSFWGLIEMAVEHSHFERNTAGWGGAIAIGQADTVTISGSTFFDNSAATGYAGALSVYDAFGVELVDNAFHGNSAQSAGGVYVDSYGSATIRRCEFLNNRAQESGGGLRTNGSALVEECTFAGNSAGKGGGLCDDGNRLMVVYAAFESNYATIGGGAWTASYDGAKFERCRFKKNHAYVGGGVAVLGAADSLFDRCEFSYNVATIGGGLSTLDYHGAAYLRSSLFAANVAFAHGGGIAGGSGLLSLENCTIAHNRADGLGAGLIGGSGTSIANSIVWGNLTDPGGEVSDDEVAQIEGIEFTAIESSNVQGWSGTYGGEGNLGADPLFVEPMDPDGLLGPEEPDYHVRADSPCINKGVTKIIDWAPWFPPPPMLDLDDKPRVLCDVVDMGAYESGLLGDLDCNFTVDLDDFSRWSQCALGPGGPDLCFALDSDGDGDTDLRDFAGFQRVFGGYP